MKPPKLRSLEVGRFLAALLIMVSHEINYVRLGSPEFLGGFSLPQPPAVAYFFVLSGFVMMNVHGGQFGQARAVLPFFWRRICRIFPVYWLMLALPLYFFWRQTGAAHLLLLVTLAPVQTADYDPVAWTLRYEAAFYLVFGASLLPRIGPVIFWGWILGMLLVWLPPTFQLAGPAALPPLRYFLANSPVFNQFFYALDVLFLGGIGAGYLFARRRIKPVLAGVIVGAGCAALVVAVRRANFGFSYGAPAAFFWTTGGFGAVMLGLAALEREGALRIGRIADELGRLSYPLYVSHAVVILLMERFFFSARSFPTMPAKVEFFLLLAPSLGLAVMLTYFFDQPIQRWLRKLG
jgi:peptidoglycan/LPS O-acetylase OafA/YrhL